LSILNLGGAEPSSPIKKNSKKVLLGIGLIVAVLGVGSTLASTITLGTNNTREFGQGVERTVFCGGSEQTIQVIPTSEFVNSDSVESAGSFSIQSIAVTNIPEKCSGVDFIISAYGTSSSSDSEGGSGAQTSAPNPSAPISLLSGDSSQTLLNVWWLKKSESCPERLSGCGGVPAAAVSAIRDDYQNISSDLVTLGVDGTSFVIHFQNGSGISTDSLNKIVVETQDDVIGKSNAFSNSYFFHSL